ncbi:MAG: hypothetical protein ACK47P_07605, partial [Bradyrhizobium sp.]
MRIGLLGGSFNPPHAAHRAISLFALKRLQLDRVWWLLTPGNPLKNHDGLHDVVAAHLATGVDQQLDQRFEFRRGCVAIDQQGLDRAADP